MQRICSSRMILPSTYEVYSELSYSITTPIAFGGFGDVYKGYLGHENVCIKRLRIAAGGDRTLVKQVSHPHNLRPEYYHLTTLKALCKEAVVWKHLNHPNIVSFRGVTFEPLQLVSEWAPGGELREYIRNNGHHILIGLVSLFLYTYNLRLTTTSVARHRQRTQLSSFTQCDPWRAQRSMCNCTTSGIHANGAGCRQTF